MEVEDGVVKSCSRTGGSRGWQLYSVSRWTEKDGERLRRHLEQEFENGNTNIYWDDVAMFYHFSDYTLGIREMKKSDIIEIDSLEELSNIDQSYSSYYKNSKQERVL
jgi:CTP:phosphocholine cytidylyltransferase-like protein